MAGYGAAVGIARMRSTTAPAEAAVERLIDERLGRSGAAGRHLYFGTSQGRIHVLEAGGDGDPLILVHGLGGSAGSYAALISWLSMTFHVVAVDLPGAGISDPIHFTAHPRSPWVDIIGEIATELSLVRPHLVGHSMGGLAAGAYCVADPARVARLVLLAPIGLAVAPPRSWLAARIPGLADLVFNLDSWAMERQWARGDGDMRGLPGGPVEVGPDPDGYRMLVSRRFRSGFDLHAFARLMTLTGFHPDSLLLPGLGLLSGRTLVIFGDEDHKVAPGPARQQLSHYPGIELKTVPGWGHLFPFLEPERTADLVETWLDPGTA